MVEASLRLTYSIGVIAALAFLGLSPDPNGAKLGHHDPGEPARARGQPWGAVAPIIAIRAADDGNWLDRATASARTAAGIDRARVE